MTRVVHLVIGHEQHGVVRHGNLVATACGHEILRFASAAEVTELPACDVVHLPFTDRLLAPLLDDAAAQFRRLAELVRRSGAALSVTLHDVPHDDSLLQRRRRELYRSVVHGARGVVVNSRTELALVQDDADAVHSLRAIELPIENRVACQSRSAAVPEDSVAVLGFVFPDRGYEHVIAALPAGATLVAVGRAADGHNDLLPRYAEVAAGRWQLTGFVPDDELGAYLDAAAVPIAPNPRVTASASINTWLAHGRRPLVPDSPYAREILAARPGTLRLYDPADHEALRAAIVASLADPSLTRLDPDVMRGPSVEAVAGEYRKHLAACAPPRVHRGGDRIVVPDNRWDLIAPSDARSPSVSVVIPHYDAQSQLDLVLAALSVQRYPRERIEVIVADDGSPSTPRLDAAGALDARVVCQDDLGFRAAAARNLGARHAQGDVLVFLDGDTVPEPDYLAAITRLPAGCADVVAVGRRRHAELSSVCVDDVRGWADGPVRVEELDEPGWLRDAYRGSADLLRADRRSYRYVISAVLALSRQLFTELGGFDERFTGYGGEDWELAHRAWCAGAVFAHVPEAVAWHDGADWAGRGTVAERRAAKNQETAALAALLPDPDARGAGRWSPYPSIVVQAGRFTDVDALATARSALAAGVDCGFWFTAIDGPHADLVRTTPGVQVGTADAAVLARAWCHASLEAPADLSGLAELAERTQRHGTIVMPTLTLRSNRSRTRTTRWFDDDQETWASLLFGRHDRAGPAAWSDLDLAATLRRAQPPVNRS